MGKSAESLLSKGLLSHCTSGGCGAKIESDGLSRLLEGLRRRPGLAPSGDKRLLVGYDTSDDAAVYMLDDTRSLIFTADFFPPWSMTPAPLGG